MSVSSAFVALWACSLATPLAQHPESAADRLPLVLEPGCTVDEAKLSAALENLSASFVRGEWLDRFKRSLKRAPTIGANGVANLTSRSVRTSSILDELVGRAKELSRNRVLIRRFDEGTGQPLPDVLLRGRLLQLTSLTGDRSVSHYLADFVAVATRSGEVLWNAELPVAECAEEVGSEPCEIGELELWTSIRDWFARPELDQEIHQGFTTKAAEPQAAKKPTSRPSKSPRPGDSAEANRPIVYLDNVLTHTMQHLPGINDAVRAGLMQHKDLALFIEPPASLEVADPNETKHGLQDYAVAPPIPDAVISVHLRGRLDQTEDQLMASYELEMELSLRNQPAAVVKAHLAARTCSHRSASPAGARSADEAPKIAQPAAATAAPLRKIEVDPPPWIQEGSGAFGGPLVSLAVFRGVGSSAPKENYVQTRLAADNQARTEVSAVLQTFFATLVKDQWATVSKSPLPDEVVTNTAAVLMSAANQKVHRVEQFWPPNGTAYVLVEISLEDLFASLLSVETLSDDLHSYIRQHGARVLSEMQRARSESRLPATIPR